MSLKENFFSDISCKNPDSHLRYETIKTKLEFIIHSNCDDNDLIDLLSALFKSNKRDTFSIPKDTISVILESDRKLLILWTLENCFLRSKDYHIFLKSILKKIPKVRIKQQSGYELESHKIRTNLDFEFILALLRNPSMPLMLEYKDNDRYFQREFSRNWCFRNEDRILYNSFWDVSIDEQCAYLSNPSVERELVSLIINPANDKYHNTENLGILIQTIVVNKSIFGTRQYLEQGFLDNFNSWYINDTYYDESIFGRPSRSSSYNKFLLLIYKQLINRYIYQSKKYHIQSDNKDILNNQIELTQSYYMIKIFFSYLQLPDNPDLSIKVYEYLLHLEERCKKNKQDFHLESLSHFKEKIISNQEDHRPGVSSPLLKIALLDQEDCRASAYAKINLSDPKKFNTYFSSLSVDQLLSSENIEDYWESYETQYDELTNTINQLIDKLYKDKDFYALWGLSRNPQIPHASFDYLRNRILFDPVLGPEHNRMSESILEMSKLHIKLNNDMILFNNLESDSKFHHIFKILSSLNKKIKSISQIEDSHSQLSKYVNDKYIPPKLKGINGLTRSDFLEIFLLAQDPKISMILGLTFVTSSIVLINLNMFFGIICTAFVISYILYSALRNELDLKNSLSLFIVMISFFLVSFLLWGIVVLLT